MLSAKRTRFLPHLDRRSTTAMSIASLCFSRDNSRPEVASDAIPGMAVEEVGLDVPVKCGGSRLNCALSNATRSLCDGQRTLDDGRRTSTHAINGAFCG